MVSSPTRAPRDYLDEIGAKLIQIREFPQIAPKVYGDFRMALTRRFPYRVFYRLTDTDQVVVAVLHQSRDFYELLAERWTLE